ncbi:protein cramped-like isoform X2 [Gigantopelta aegis]|uniref:protein cramped-like isoform X2 n=1 Tax=Gigantopelta aegis TaxID=1735272 RepID=UPI001B889822|nr:protein cramped-like isoform X2 [Gigantopelta aegis]
MPPSKRRRVLQDENAAKEEAGCRVTSSSAPVVVTCFEEGLKGNISSCSNVVREVSVEDGLNESVRMEVVCAGNDEPKQDDGVCQSGSVCQQEQELCRFSIQNSAAGESEVGTTDNVDPAEDVGEPTEVKSSPASCRSGVVTERRKRHSSKSDCVSISPIEPLKISTVAGTAKRSSTRIVKKTRRDFSPPLSPVKKVPHAVEGKSSTPETKTKRNWDLWTDYDKKNFFEGVCEHGKDFEAICHMMQMKCKKRGITGTAIKNKDQVRFFYYRTWNKISKFISVQGDVRKEIIELYGLINYGLLRETIKLKRLNPKTALKLNELIEHGSTTYRIKGKNRKIRTPACPALKKIHCIQDSKEECALRVPSKVVLELVPRTNTAWSHVQSLAQNPRLKISLSSSRSLSSVIEYIGKKWKGHRLKLKEDMDAVEVEKEFKLFPQNATAIPTLLCPQFVPRVDITFANFRDKILSSPQVNSKSRKAHDTQAHKPSSDNSSESDPVTNISPKSVKHCKDKNVVPEKTENVLLKSCPVTAFLQDDNAMFPDAPLSSLVTTNNADGTVEAIKVEETDVDMGDKNSSEDKSNTAEDEKVPIENVDDADTDKKAKGGKSEDMVQMAVDGFTVGNAKNVTLAELLLMFGTLSDGHVKLEYEWFESVNIEVQLSQLANMLRRLSQMATMEFCEASRSKSNTHSKEKSCGLCGTAKHKMQNQQTQTANTARSKQSRADQEMIYGDVSQNMPTIVRLPSEVSTAADGVFRVPLGIPLMRYPTASQNMSVNVSQVMNSLNPKQSNVLMPRNRRRPFKRQVIVQRTLLPKVPTGGIYEVLPANPASQEAVQANQNSTILPQPFTVSVCTASLDTGQQQAAHTVSSQSPLSIVSHYDLNTSTVDPATVVSLPEPLTVDTGQTSGIISAAAAASGLSPIPTVKEDLLLTSSVSPVITSCFSSVVPSSSINSTAVQSVPRHHSISPPNLSSLLDISLSCNTNASDNADKFLDMVNSNTGFSGLLGTSKNLSSGSDEHSRLMTPPHSPGSLQDKVTFSGGDSKFWLNGEGLDISLSSLLVESPSKKSYTTSTSSFIPAPPALFSEHSQDSIVSKLDVDSTLQVMMNENSMDYVSKFENLAAHIEGTNYLSKSDHPKTFKMFKS